MRDNNICISAGYIGYNPVINEEYEYIFFACHLNCQLWKHKYGGML